MVPSAAIMARRGEMVVVKGQEGMLSSCIVSPNKKRKEKKRNK